MKLLCVVTDFRTSDIYFNQNEKIKKHYRLAVHFGRNITVYHLSKSPTLIGRHRFDQVSACQRVCDIQPCIACQALATP